MNMASAGQQGQYDATAGDENSTEDPTVIFPGGRAKNSDAMYAITRIRGQQMSDARQQAGKPKPPIHIGAVKGLLAVVILFLACLAAFSSRLFAVIRFESIIHEFDPWFNYRSTHYLVTHGFYNFLNWFDERAWSPLGRIVGGTVYPGLMVTSGAIYNILHSLNIPIHIRDVCVFLAPLFSGLTALAAYGLTTELWDASAGLLAACFIAIVPGYISRSVAGSYDNEGIAIFALLFTYYLWIKAVKTGSIAWASATALLYFYMVSAWGGYVFIINLIPLHVCVLLLMGRFSNRVYVAFCTFYILGTLMSMQIPFVGFQPVRTSEHMAAAGTFVLLQAFAFLRYIQDFLTKQEFRSLFFFGVLGTAGITFMGVVFLTYAGYVAPWSGRFYSLYDTGYAKIHIPIIASVSEHQPTTWVSFFFDLHILVCTFPAGLWFVIKDINDERVFIALYALSAVYFAGVMVRLMLTLTPVVCILAAIAISKTLNEYLVDELPKKSLTGEEEEEEEEEDADRKNRKYYDKAGKVRRIKTDKGKDDEGMGGNLKGFVVVAIIMTLMLFSVHCTWVTSNAYSSPSIVLASHNQDGSRVILDDFREAYYWLRKNTDDHARVMSWWDYGYQIAGMGNKTTLVDNNTWNNSHIALVGKAMSSNETAAYKIMRDLSVDYVLVIFGGVIGYSGDDINKFLWMVRIAEGEHPRDIKESNYFTPNGEFRVDKAGSPTLHNCLMYKMCYYRFGELQLDFRSPAGFDRTRGVEIGKKDISFEHLEEAYTTEHWLVRVYKVKPLSNRVPSQNLLKRKAGVKKYVSKKTSKKRRGSIKNKPAVKRGKRTRGGGKVNKRI
ncbi:dolichyl-diphosphooligosaccharide--protein glycosyltransferase subunit STT3B [Strongylocentrotus purpuratus]|uniref:dolichyl-diphosphooligosaccharide--protein glycotransferase n=1 Tax=Strongylocentrotus purpuratus TaxID=7668 RepID=A0A7M7PTZ4_STRPU|nr:dolichyl-diphosphooligosaccharide--protein glycosyltransferase subunit STT3B [Strongylocentrotus purpuratus]|eukprot:XP_786317.3 PREDICTED: dolichyl-diphosphooligosaccharide--protein glycosyltransferase subunit STT3B [Strongylocentrotus purpuratus]